MSRSPWTGLLEALHSALIDELTDRHPEPKPVLDLPRRHSSWTIPGQDVTTILRCEFQFGDQAGTALLALAPPFAQALGLTPILLWQAVLKRAGSEFHLRHLHPKLGPVNEFSTAAPPPENLGRARRLVWIPLQIPAGRCFLGLTA